jgi:hypothetical protein
MQVLSGPGVKSFPSPSIIPNETLLGCHLGNLGHYLGLLLLSNVEFGELPIER